MVSFRKRAGAAMKAMFGDDPPAAVDEDEDALLEASLDRVEAEVTGKVPPMVEARVTRIVTTLRDTLPRLDQLGRGSSQAHAAVQTAASYLPEALGAYLRLPRSYADERPVSGGKTSLMILCDQLDLLGNKMDEVFVAVCQSDADALIAHGRFLADKFGSGTLAITPRDPSAPDRVVPPGTLTPPGQGEPS